MAQKQPVGMAIAKFDYKTTDSHELNISKGEKLTLLDDSQHWWQVMNSKGDTGYVPSNFCKKSKQGIFSSLRNTLGRKKSKDHSQPVSCGASSVGTAPSSASGRRSVTPSPKNNNQNLSASESINNGNVDDCNRNRQHDNSNSHISGGNPFYSMGSLKSNDSNTQLNSVNQKSVQSMSYNAGQQVPMNTDKHNQSQTNLPIQMPHFPMHKIPCCDPQFNNSSFHQMNGRDYSNSDGPKSKDPGTGYQDSISDPVQLHRQEQLMTGSSGSVGMSNTGSLGPSALCVAKFSYTPCQPDELALSKGDKIKVLEKSSDGWWRGELMISNIPLVSTGWFPSNYVTLDRQQNNSGFRSATDSLGRPLQSPPIQSSGLLHSSMPSVISNADPPPNAHNNDHKTIALTNIDSIWCPSNIAQTVQRYSTVLTLYPFSKNQFEEMSFEANEILEVIERPVDDPDWWRCRNVNGDIGLVPRNYVKQLTSTGALLTKQPPLPLLPESAKIFDQRLYTPNIEIDNLRMNFNKTGRYKDRIWYWGNISRIECESFLIAKGYLGQFVVRDSESHPGDLTITMHARTKCRNFKVNIENAEFHIGQKVFSSIEALIQHYRNHPIYKSDNDRLFLSDPFQYQSSTSNLYDMTNSNQ